MRSVPPSRSRGWHLGHVLIGIALSVALLYYFMTKVFFSDDNEPAAKSIVAAVEAFNKDQGRYPQKLEELVPKYLSAIPTPPSKYFFIVYAADSGGKECWVAYQVHRESYEEYDCQTRAWRLMEWEDLQAVKRKTGEWIKPTPH